MNLSRVNSSQSETEDLPAVLSALSCLRRVEARLWPGRRSLLQVEGRSETNRMAVMK